jgi:capsular exopolysaccharide synthesis family protein
MWEAFEKRRLIYGMTQPQTDNTTRQTAATPLASDEIDLGKVMGVIWRGKLVIALCGILAVFAGGLYTFALTTPLFTAATTVVLESRQEQIVDIESVVSGLSGDQVDLNTEIQILRSRRLLGKLVDDLDLTQDPEFNATLRPDPGFSPGVVIKFVRDTIKGQAGDNAPPTQQEIKDAAIDELLRIVTVTNIRQSYVFRIAAFSPNPVRATQITNRLAELYVADQIALKFEKTVEATKWLTDRVAELQIELEVIELELSSFSSNTDLISPEGLVALNRQLKNLRDRQSDLADEGQSAETFLTALQQAQATDDLAQMAAAAENRDLNTLIAQDGGETAVRRSFDTILSEAEAEVARLQTQRATVARSIEDITASIAAQTDELVALEQLNREVEASRLIYEFFLGRLKEMSVQQGLQQAESRVLSYAVQPRNASSPRVSLVLMLSLFCGVALGIAIVMLREKSKRIFRVAKDLEVVTGYAVLGQIPTVPSRNRGKVLQYLRDKPNSAAAEAIRNLRTSLLLANLDNPPKIIMSTSSVPGEGKTTQSIALALNLASLGKKVLLLEGDVRRRVMNEYFDIPQKPGFLSVMLGETDLDSAITHVDTMKFDVLLGEKAQANAADIFSSDRFGAFLKTLRAKYDYVIIDTPPVLAVADARIIGGWVDATIYTVRWDSTSHRQVLDGLASFQQVNVKVSGLVLGQISLKGMKRYGYGDSQGTYGAYYDT